jgi:hypothetical protein
MERTKVRLQEVHMWNLNATKHKHLRQISLCSVHLSCVNVGEWYVRCVILQPGFVVRCAVCVEQQVVNHVA